VTDTTAPATGSVPTADAATRGGGAPPLSDKLEPEGRRALILLLVAVFVVFLNETMMGVAAPTIIADPDINVTPAMGQWLTTAFALTMAVVIPITGWLLQRLNTRPVYILAISIFALGTLIAAFAPGFEVLVAGRVVQAMGTAIMMPLMMTTVMTIVPQHLRGRIMGRVSIVMSLAPALGPVAGGLLLDAFNDYWRALFLVMLPLAIIALVLGIVLVPNVTKTRRIPLDAASLVLAAVGFSGLVYGLSSFGLAAESSAVLSPWIPLVIGIVVLLAFGLRQRALQRRDAAFLDLRTFKAYSFSLVIVLMTLGTLTLFGLIIVMPIYLQYVRLAEPSVIGAVVFPGALLMGILGPTVGRLFDKFGPRPLVIPGAIVASIAAWTLLVVVNAETPILLVGGVYTLLFLGFAFIFPPLFTVGLGALPYHLYSHGSAIVATIQQVAGAAGAAVFTALLTIGMASRGSTDVTAGNIAGIVDGTHYALLGGAIASVGLVVASLFLRRPTEPEVSEESLHAGH
jgi:MFS transporter, DHA2 family, lincomycin resistance protein